MSIFATAFVCALMLGITGCSSTGTVADDQGAVFSFVFYNTPCGVNPVDVLDTNAGTLAHTPLLGSETITVPLRLTDEELDRVQQKAEAVDFFDYPANYVVPETYILGMVAPVSTYRLSVTDGPRTNDVTWTAGAISDPEYTPARQLRELIELIMQILCSHAEFQQLPALEGEAGCL